MAQQNFLHYILAIPSILILLCSFNTFFLMLHSSAILKIDSDNMKGYNQSNGWSRNMQVFNLINTSQLYDDAVLNFLTDVLRMDKYSLLITVKGERTDELPYMIINHINVFPVTPDHGDSVEFLSDHMDSYRYLSGPPETKMTVTGILEALSYKIEKEGQPQRSFYIALSHDPQGFRGKGASEIFARLKSNGLKKLDFVLNGGMPILSRLFRGMEYDIVPIGVAQKGRVCLNISVNDRVYVPPDQTKLDILLQAIMRLRERSSPPVMNDVTREFFRNVGMYMRFPLNLIFTNLWLFEPIAVALLGEDSEVKWMMKNTRAWTMMRGNWTGNAAWAVVDHHIHIKSSINEVVNVEAQEIVDDERFTVEPCANVKNYEPQEYDEVTKDDSPYHIIRKAFHQTFPHAIVAPAVMWTTSNMGDYLPHFTKNIFRAIPLTLTRDELKRAYREDGKFSEKSYSQVVKFYYHLMINSDLSLDPTIPGYDEL